MKKTALSGIIAALMMSGHVANAQSTSVVQYAQGTSNDIRGQSRLEQPTFREPAKGESIFERPRPDYEPIGVRAGSFIFSPAVTFATEYNDNIFTADESDNGRQVEDVIFVVSPGLRVDSDWENHSLSFRAGARSGNYYNNSTQDYTDTIAAINGAYDISRNFYVGGGLSTQQLHEERGSPNSRGGNQFGPTKYNLSIANAVIAREVGLIGFSLEGNATRWDYDPNATLSNNDRDRDDLDVSGKITYSATPDYKLYLRVGGNTRNYDNSRDSNNFRRHSTGSEYVVGANFDITSLVTAEAYGGWAMQDYDDSRFSAVETPILGGSLLWTVTELTSLRATATRQIQDSVQQNISSYVESAYRATLEHELMRNFLVGAALEYRTFDFRGVRTDRDDKFYQGDVGARYLLNRNMTVGADYTYRTRISNVASQDYTQNSIVGTFGLRF